MEEQKREAINGYGMLVLGILSLVAMLAFFVIAVRAGEVVVVVWMLPSLLMGWLILSGLFMVHPNQARVLQIFGAYAGTAREPGLRWANPFYTKKAVSTRVRNFESSKLKVNDSRGSPIEIAAVVVWKVVDTAEAIFEVDDQGYLRCRR